MTEGRGMTKTPLYVMRTDWNAKEIHQYSHLTILFFLPLLVPFSEGILSMNTIVQYWHSFIFAHSCSRTHLQLESCTVGLLVAIEQL